MSKYRRSGKKWECPFCFGMFDPRGRRVHLRAKHPSENEDSAAASMGALGDMTDVGVTDRQLVQRALNVNRRPPSTRTRYRRRDSIELVDPLHQLPDAPVLGESAGTFILDPQGATIAEAVSWYPVGGAPEDGLPAKYTVNSAEYIDRYIVKRGKEKLGPTLTPAHIRRIVDVISENRADEIRQVEYDLIEAQEVIASGATENERTQAKRRTGQLRSRLDLLRQLIDKDAICEELDNIARAKRLAKLTPEQRDAVMLILEERESKVVGLVQRELLRNRGPREGADDPDLVGVGANAEVRHNANWEGVADEFSGRDEILIDNDD